jgi:hypothetical protein
MNKTVENTFADRSDGCQKRANGRSPAKYSPAWMVNSGVMVQVSPKKRSLSDGHCRDTAPSGSESIGRTGSELGGGEATAEESPPAGRLTDETDYYKLGEDTKGYVGMAATHGFLS